MHQKPSILLIIETWLYLSVGVVDLASYFIVVRRDRRDGRIGCGVIVFAVASIVHNITPTLDSNFAERVWIAQGRLAMSGNNPSCSGVCDVDILP